MPTQPGQTAGRLYSWGLIDERRRRRRRPALLRISGWGLSVLVGLVLAGVVAWTARTNAGPQLLRASRLWFAMAIAAYAVLVMSAPFRLYWRSDSAFLCRLPIPGRAVFFVGLMRTARSTGLTTLSLLIALVPIALSVEFEIAMRHAALAGIGAAGAICLGPFAALAAGALVASGKADSVLSSMGGEFQAPKTSWLGALPGFAATAVVVTLIAGGNWIVGAPTTAVGSPTVLFGLGLGVAALALLWSVTRSETVMAGAAREVVALDAERLAHVDLVGPTRIDSVFSRFLNGRGAQLVFRKDATLTRRRYPMPYLIAAIGLLSQWICAAVEPVALLAWVGAIAGGIGVYGLIVAQRLTATPIENPRLLRSLPIPNEMTVRAKRVRAAMWTVVYIVLGTVPVAIRAADVTTVGVLTAITAGSLLLGGFIASRVHTSDAHHM